MMVGCIPVIIADEIEFPYENTMDWWLPFPLSPSLATCLATALPVPSFAILTSSP